MSIIYIFAPVKAKELCKGTLSPILLQVLKMIKKEDIMLTIQPLVEQKNAFIVDVIVKSSNKIIVELDSFDKVTIDDCVDISRLIESNFNRDTEDYELEVSSAGLSSPFKVIEQYQKNLGKEIETVTKEGKKLTGILSHISEKSFKIDIKKTEKVEGKKKRQEIIETIEIPFDKAKFTKVVFNFK